MFHDQPPFSTCLTRLFDHNQSPYSVGAGVGMHSVSDKVTLACFDGSIIDADGVLDDVVVVLSIS
jgi:hypothetical protein